MHFLNFIHFVSLRGKSLGIIILLHVLLSVPWMQVPDFSLPGPNLRAVFAVSTLEGWNNIFLQDKWQAGLLLAIKVVASPKLSVAQLWYRLTLCEAPIWASLLCHDAEHEEMMQMCCPSFCCCAVSINIFSLWPRSLVSFTSAMRQEHANLLACKILAQQCPFLHVLKCSFCAILC